MSENIRVRFAPSPTGYLHVGGARTALFNWLYARHHGGKFILRIEDTDQARNTPEAMQAIFDGLNWLGLDWDEGPEKGGDFGPYYQSQRQGIYDAYMKKLEDAGRVYAEENGAVRFKFSRIPILIPDLVCGDVNFAATDEPDMTLRRPDGSYIFHFVNVVDDIEMGITHVIRGEDHLSNTWKHIDLYRAFGAEPPRFGHIPLLLNPSGSKMSKRDEGASIESYIQSGFHPEAVFNYLCLLGWTPKTEGEVLLSEQAVQLFDVAEIHHSNARFDMVKCRWLNQHYLRALAPEALDAFVRKVDQATADPASRIPHLETASTSLSTAAFQSVKEKVSVATEFAPWVHFFFRDDFPIEEEVMAKLNANAQSVALLTALDQDLKGAMVWDEANITAIVTQVATEQGVKAGALMPLLRFSLSGQTRGPDVKVMMGILGQDQTTSRIRRLIATLS
ncbi:glutamate--tRNA ligase [soil metagenome]